jgi:hypothetical protein
VHISQLKRGLFAAFVIGTNAMAAPATTPSNGLLSDEAQFVVEQNKQSYEKVRDVSYEFESRYEGTQEPKIHEQVGSAEQCGSAGFFSVHTTTTWKYSDGRVETDSKRAFIGPASFGETQANGSAAREYLHDSMDTMSDDAKGFASAVRPPHLERYAFGDGYDVLPDYIRKTMKNARMYDWRVEHKNESQTLLAMYMKLNGTTGDFPALLFRLDPQRGFIITSIEQRLPTSGRLIRECKIDSELIKGKNQWYPTRVVERFFGQSPQNADSPQWTIDTRIKNVAIVTKFPKDDFSLASLQLQDGSRLARVSTDGKQSVLSYHADGLRVDDGASEAKDRQDAMAVVAARPIPTLIVVLSAGAAIAGVALIVVALRRRGPARHKEDGSMERNSGPNQLCYKYADCVPNMVVCDPGSEGIPGVIYMMTVDPPANAMAGKQTASDTLGGGSCP